MLLALPRELLVHVFARVPLTELNDLFRTSRDFRDLIRHQAPLRRQLARSLFDGLAAFWRRVSYDVIGDTFISRCAVRQEAGVVHVGYRYEVRVDRMSVFQNTIRMQIRLVADHVNIEVFDNRVVRIPLLYHLGASNRVETFVIRPVVDQIESCRNGVVGLRVPVPQGVGLLAYVCEAVVNGLE